MKKDSLKNLPSKTGRTTGVANPDKLRELICQLKYHEAGMKKLTQSRITSIHNTFAKANKVLARERRLLKSPLWSQWSWRRFVRRNSPRKVTEILLELQLRDWSIFDFIDLTGGRDSATARDIQDFIWE